MADRQAIETTYAGCRFRSRLEARWAILFDHLGIYWEYEPQGFQTTHGDRYLPDFKLCLHDSERWVEVKGTDDHIDSAYREKIGALIDFGGPLSEGLLLLGPIPDPIPWTEINWTCAYWHKGVVTREEHFTLDNALKETQYSIHAGDVDTGFLPQSATWQPTPIRVQSKDVWWQMEAPIRDAYLSARSARFEHGETPNRPATSKLDPPIVPHVQEIENPLERIIRDQYDRICELEAEQER